MAARRDRQFAYEPLGDQPHELHTIARKPMASSVTDSSTLQDQHGSDDGLQVAPRPDNEGLQVRSPTPRILHQSAFARPPAAELKPPPQQYLPPPPPPLPPSPQAHRNPLGLRPFEFAVVVALITAIIVGGAVGGGVGGTLAAQSSQLQAANAAHRATTTAIAYSTATTAYSASTPAASSLVNYTGLDPSTVTRLAVDCPNLNTNPYTTPRNDTFNFTCGWDLPGNSKADANLGGSIMDMVGLVAYRVEDCVIACSNMNYFENRTACHAVTFWPQLGTSFIEQGANCWLKNASGPGVADSNGKVSGTIHS